MIYDLVEWVNFPKPQRKAGAAYGLPNSFSCFVEEDWLRICLQATWKKEKEKGSRVSSHVVDPVNGKQNCPPTIHTYTIDRI